MDFHNNNELDAAAIGLTQADITVKRIFRKNDYDWNVGLRKHEKTGNTLV